MSGLTRSKVRQSSGFWGSKIYTGSREQGPAQLRCNSSLLR